MTALAAGVAAVATLVTPLSVFLVNWEAIDPGYADISHVRDPLVGAQVPVAGIVYAVQALVMTAALILGALAISRISVQTGPARLASISACGAALAWLLQGGVASAWYAGILLGSLGEVQSDATVRKMIGYADVLSTQGVMGAAGVATAVWLTVTGIVAHKAGWIGRSLPIVTSVLSVPAVAAYVFGVPALAVLVVVLPLLVVAVWTLVVSGARASHS